jgi:hypothetical protein
MTVEPGVKQGFDFVRMAAQLDADRAIGESGTGESAPTAT